jgi:AraC family transcriptional regulator
MNYAHYIRVSLEYIERRLTKRITLEDVADRACFSLFHFHRLFSEITGCSMKDYIRTRRLSEAGRELVDTSAPIPEIAERYGFESQGSFTRAFRRQFKITPGRLRREKLPFPYLQPFRIVEVTHEKGVMMEPRFVELGELNVVGKVYRTTPGSDHSSNQMQGFDPSSPGIGNPLYSRTTYLSVTCYTDVKNLDAASEIRFMIGIPVSKPDSVPEDMEVYTIPPALYAVFTHHGPAADIGKTYLDIYGKHLVGYELAEADQIGWYDERYRYDQPGSEFDIYIPVKSREHHA